MKSKFAGAIAALTLTLGVVGSANAIGLSPSNVYDWSFVDLTDQGSGTLTTGALDPTRSLNSPAGYDITAITGQWDSSAITGLLPPGTCCLSPANNNIIYIPPSPAYFDIAGLGFGVANGDQVNIYDPQGAQVIVNSGPSNSGTFTLTATPLPAALPLFAGGLGVMGLFGWRRKRKAAAIATA